MTAVPYYVPASSFTGLLDTYPSALAAYSFRKLRSGYLGSAARIRASGDNAEADFGFDGNGDFDSAGVASFLTTHGGSGFVKTLYDQSGNTYDVTQVTQGLQPAYVASGINSKPAFDLVAANTTGFISGTDVVSHGGTLLSCFAVAREDAVTPATGRLVSLTVAGFQDYDATNRAAVILDNFQLQAFGSFRVSGLMNGGTLTYGTPLSMGVIWDGTNHTNYSNGTGGTPEANSGAFAANLTLRIGYGPDSVYWDGYCSEIILWASDQTANVAGIDADHSSYWGV